MLADIDIKRVLSIKERNTKVSKGSKIVSVKEVEAIKGKGLTNDRKFKENNEITRQITLIEIESINQYNILSKTTIPAINFRRNIVTKDIKLNIIKLKLTLKDFE